MKPYGYKLYKKHKEYHNDDYAAIKAIQDIYKQEYSKIENSNVLTTLLKKILNRKNILSKYLSTQPTV